MVAPYSSRRGLSPHDHEFVEPSYELVEDGAWHVNYDCHYEEIVNSYTDSARDETYYETGASCEAEKSVRLDCSRIEKRLMGGERETVAEGDSVLLSDEYEAWGETIESKLVSELGREFPSLRGSTSTESATIIDVNDELRVVDVRLSDDDIYDGYELEPGTYRVYYDNAETEVYER
jgi:hypothetical protein